MNSFSVTMAISYSGYYFLPFATKDELAPVVSFTEIGVIYLTQPFIITWPHLIIPLIPSIVLELKNHVQIIKKIIGKLFC